MSETTKPLNKADRNKIIFLTIAIIALLGSNAYLYFKDKHENERYITAGTEKDRLKLEVEKIEVELDKINAINVNLNDKLIKEQDLARQQIAQLKAELEKGKLTRGELVLAQKKITELKEYILNYNQEIAKLDKENQLLRIQSDSLQKTIEHVNERANALQQVNAELNQKVITGAALKAANMNITAFKVKNSGKNVEVSHASTAKKLMVNFSIAPNQLASKDYHKVYLRIFDPAGNLMANEENMFEAEGQEMQFTEMISISFNDDNTEYEMQWINPEKFIKGTYTAILYADGYMMGKSMISLK